MLRINWCFRLPHLVKSLHFLMLIQPFAALVYVFYHKLHNCSHHYKKTRRYAYILHFCEFPFEIAKVNSKCDFVSQIPFFQLKRKVEWEGERIIWFIFCKKKNVVSTLINIKNWHILFIPKYVCNDLETKTLHNAIFYEFIWWFDILLVLLLHNLRL